LIYLGRLADFAISGVGPLATDETKSTKRGPKTLARLKWKGQNRQLQNVVWYNVLA
jgi:hypothetical protein